MCQGFVSLDILAMDSVVPSSTLLLYHLHSLLFFSLSVSLSVFFVCCAHAMLEDYYV